MTSPLSHRKAHPQPTPSLTCHTDINNQQSRRSANAQTASHRDHHGAESDRVHRAGLLLSACGSAPTGTAKRANQPGFMQNGGQMGDPSAMFTSALASLVADGTITSTQRDTVVAAIKKSIPGSVHRGACNRLPAQRSTRMRSDQTLRACSQRHSTNWSPTARSLRPRRRPSAMLSAPDLQTEEGLPVTRARPDFSPADYGPPSPRAEMILRLA